MTEKNTSAGAADEDKLGTVWEDTVIIAFRDLQWRRWLDDIDEATPAEADAVKRMGPDGFHKLDDDAESLFGDILTGYDGRFFVLEFKAVRAGHRKERGKKMFEAVSTHLIMADTKEERDQRDRFMKLSTSCHFGAFGSRILKGQSKRPTLQQIIGGSDVPSIPNEPRMGNLAIDASTYLDWIHVRHRDWMSMTGEEKAKLPGQRQTYVKLLSQVVQVDTYLAKAMEGITADIRSTTRRSLTTLVWGEEKERAGAQSDDYIEYLTLLTEIVGGDPDTPITLLAVVDRTIFYWTTSADRLKHSLAYWANLKKQAVVKTAADLSARQDGTAPATDQAKGAHTGTLKAKK